MPLCPCYLNTALLAAMVQASYSLNWHCLTPQRQGFLKKAVWKAEAIMCCLWWGCTQALVAEGSMGSVADLGLYFYTKKNGCFNSPSLCPVPLHVHYCNCWQVNGEKQQLVWIFTFWYLQCYQLNIFCLMITAADALTVSISISL